MNMRTMILLAAATGMSGCASGHWMRMIPNTQRVAWEKDWVPVNGARVVSPIPPACGSIPAGTVQGACVADNCAELKDSTEKETCAVARAAYEAVVDKGTTLAVVGAGPEPSGRHKQGLLDYSAGDPGFLCIEPVTPVTKLHNFKGKVDALDKVTVEGDYTQELGQNYNISDVVLLAQTQAFQVCIARMAGEITETQYMEKLTEISERAMDLVLAQTAGDVTALLADHRALVDAESACAKEAPDQAARDAQCGPYRTAADALLARMPDILAATKPKAEGK